MVLLADQFYRWQEEPSDSADDEFLFKGIQAMRAVFGQRDFPTLTSTECTLQVALDKLEEEPVKKIKAPEMQSAMTIMQDMARSPSTVTNSLPKIKRYMTSYVQNS